MNLFRRGTVLAAALLVTTPALAKDGPVIERAEDAGGQPGVTAPGRPLKLHGRRLHTCSDETCRHTELTVTVAGERAMVLSAKDDLVQVMTPLATRPNRTIKVTLAARGRGSSSVRVKVLPAIQGTEGPSDAGDRVRQGFQITSFTLERTNRGAVFKVAGTAKVPDGLVVRLRLAFDHRPQHVAERLVPVKGDAFATSFGPYRRQVNLGNWGCELFFALGIQSRIRRRRWVSKLKPAEQQALKRIVRQAYVSVGAGPDGKLPAADLRAARERVVAHAKGLMAGLRALAGEAREAYALGARCFFKPAGKPTYDADAYRTWLVTQGLAADAAAAKQMADDTRYGTRRGHFDAKAYATCASDLLARLGKLQARQAAFDARTLVPVDARVSRAIAVNLGLALRLQQRWSRALHQRAGVTLPASLKREPFRAGATGQPSWKALQASLRTLEALIRSR